VRTSIRAAFESLEKLPTRQQPLRPKGLECVIGGGPVRKNKKSSSTDGKRIGERGKARLRKFIGTASSDHRQSPKFILPMIIRSLPCTLPTEQRDPSIVELFCWRYCERCVQMQHRPRRGPLYAQHLTKLPSRWCFEQIGGEGVTVPQKLQCNLA
jgi:hypothetical protein